MAGADPTGWTCASCQCWKPCAPEGEDAPLPPELVQERVRGFLGFTCDKYSEAQLLHNAIVRERTAKWNRSGICQLMPKHRRTDRDHTCAQHRALGPPEHV